MPGGRPIKYTPDELKKRIDDYFLWADTNNKPYTIARLALFLDLDRQTVYNYKDKDEFFDIIKKARDRILSALEEALYTEGKPGQIFIAKNYGYTDKQDIESKNINITQDITMLSPDERAKRIQELESKLNGRDNG